MPLTAFHTVDVAEVADWMHTDRERSRVIDYVNNRLGNHLILPESAVLAVRL